MTSAAPIDRTRSTFRVLQTPVTSVPNARAICTANVPTPPEAPLMRTFCPGWIRPSSRRPSRAVLAANGTAAACSNDRFFGFGASSPSWTQTYSAKPPCLSTANTSSPGRNAVTSLPTASTSPCPATTRCWSGCAPPPSTPMTGTTCEASRTSGASHVVPVIGVDGGGAHPDQHLVVAGHGLVDVRELQD